jgi:hypothetical protein
MTKSRKMKWAGDIDGKDRRKRLLGRPRHKWVDNFKMNFREI